MSIATILYIVGLIFGIVAVVEANGRSWAGWGCICIAAGLLWGVLK